MSFDTCEDVWVFIGYFQGQPKSVGLELLGQGRRLAGGLEQKLRVVVIAKDVDETVKEAGKYGADKIYVIKGDEYENYPADAYGSVFLKLCEKYDPNTILVGATVNGGDLGSKIIVSLHTGLTTDCTALSADGESGSVVWERPVFSGNFYAQILCSEAKPQIGTCGPDAFKKSERIPDSKPEIIMESVHTPESEIRTRVIGFIKAYKDNDIPLQDAEVVVSGGRGMKNGENFKVLKELADVLGGMVGCSRVAVDSGWMSQSKQVGQAGTTITPKICLACAISGAVQHVAGMSGSGTIVVINKDDTAPIFEVTDYDIVGDVPEVVPALVRELGARQQG